MFDFQIIHYKLKCPWHVYKHVLRKYSVSQMFAHALKKIYVSVSQFSDGDYQLKLRTMVGVVQKFQNRTSLFTTRTSSKEARIHHKSHQLCSTL